MLAFPLQGQAAPADEAEAQQLYSRANDYVSNISESGYSYAYIQFYWKRAQSNLDRVLRVYPQTAVGRELRANARKIGPYDLAYFKDRVLPRIEEKKTAAFDPVNCAIFLYNLDEKREDAERTAALESIIEVLCRQQRFNEALVFPVLDEQRFLLHTTVFRVAARYSQQKVLKTLSAKATPAEAAAYGPILGEAMALNGVPRTEIARYVKDHPAPEVRLAILSAMASREVDFQRAAALRAPIKDSLPKTHYSLAKPRVRDDVEAVAKTFFDQPNVQSEAILDRYRASLGRKPRTDAPLDEQLAYLDGLAAAEKWGEVAAYPGTHSLTSSDQRTLELKRVELLAGRGDEETTSTSPVRHPTALDRADQAGSLAYAQFRGRMNSPAIPVVVREHTFADLKIEDPCVLAQLILEWTLTPNRAIRGAAPWDPVVQRFLPGYENLPLPKSKAVQDAAGASKPF